MNKSFDSDNTSAQDNHVTGNSTHRRPLHFYLKGFLLVAAIIIPAASVQIFVVLDASPFTNGGIDWPLFIMPLVVIMTAGFLVGRILLLGYRLRHSSEKFRAVADVAKEFIYLRSVEGDYEYVSPSCKELCGYSQEHFYAMPNFMDTLIHPEDLDRWKDHIHNINHSGAPEHFDIRLITRNDCTVWISHNCIPVFDDSGQQIGVRSSNVDITERKVFEKRIEHMAYFDPLSNLPNRRSLERTINLYIDEKKENQEPFALLFLDLDRLKYINDSYGHYLGDKLLRKISRLLLKSVGDGYISRFGGDEFVIVAHHIKNADEAAEYAQKIIRDLEQPFMVDEHKLYLTGCIGISFYPDDGQNSDELVKNADAAMYQSKLEKQSKIYFYQPKLAKHANNFISIESALRKALENNELEFYYQPKVSLPDRKVVGLEALARWMHPTRGMIPPDQFIPVAEETGLILPIGELLFSNMLEDMMKWKQHCINTPVAINISARQFIDKKFCESLEREIEHFPLPANQLQIEITEQVFLRNLDETISKLRRIKEHGVTIAIDDFGTGYSSLNYIKMLPIDTIKIDRTFVVGALEDPKDLAVLKAMASLCKGLSLEMIAEGIETEAQQQLVQDIGCYHAQGFLFHRPMPASDIESLLGTCKKNTGSTPKAS